MVSNQELLDKIQEWDAELSTNDNKYIHMALLEIFIEFEKFLTSAFIEYALGGQGKDNFSPTLRLSFQDEEHLKGLLKCDKTYIDYVKKIKEIRGFVFEENTCPFNKVFSTADFSTHFSQTQLLRNFIAHQSEESKYKYTHRVLKNQGINTFIKADTFLKRIKRNTTTSYYSIYIENMKFNSEIICNPNP